MKKVDNDKETLYREKQIERNHFVLFYQELKKMKADYNNRKYLMIPKIKCINMKWTKIPEKITLFLDKTI